MDGDAMASDEELFNVENAKRVLASNWAGLKFAMESRVNASESNSDAGPACRREAGALWLEPEDLAKWAVDAMARGPDLAENFPWHMEDEMAQALSKQVSDNGLPRSLDLAEAQGLCALMWLLHGVYEIHDEKAAENDRATSLMINPFDLPGRYAPEHALQLPWSPASGEDKGSEGYFRCVFSFASGDAGSDLGERTMAAFEAMKTALERSGALDASRWLAESSLELKAAAPARRVVLADLDALESMEDFWERLDISRAAALAVQSGPARRI
jgi:hypothetical protein